MDQTSSVPLSELEPSQALPKVLERGFFFIRHGESTANALQVISGSVDVDLTAKGRAQAYAAADIMAGRDISAVFASPQRRAFDTAVPSADRLGQDIRVLDGLREQHWGPLEGQPWAARQSLLEPPEGGEPHRLFRQRVWSALLAIDGALQEIPSTAPVLIVAHSGVYRLLLSLLSIPPIREKVPNGVPMLFTPPEDGVWDGAPWTVTSVA
ncbi:MAG: histidine phosphatase family protein [Rhodospirillaceae bacterium]